MPNDLEFSFEEPNESQVIDNQDAQEQDVQVPVTNEENKTEEQVDNSSYDNRELYKFLKDSGIAPEVENIETIKNLNDISQLLYKKQQEEINARLEQELSTMNDTYKDLFSYLKNGGNLQEFVKNYNDNYDTIDIADIKDNAILQDKIIYDYYKATTQWDDKMIRKMMDKLDDDEKAQFGKTSLNSLKQIQSNRKQQMLIEQQEQIKQAEEQKYQLLNNYKQQITNLNKIGNLELTINDKKEIENLLFNDGTYNKLNSDFEKYRLPLVVLDKFGLLDDINKLSEVLNNNTNKQYNFKKQTANNKPGNIDDIIIELRDAEKTAKDNIKNMNWF